MLGSVIVQRLNVINTNGVHFNPVSGNQELLALNCGEHKPPRLEHARKQPQRSKGASNITHMTSPYNDPQYKANRRQILSDGKATICALCGKPGANTADHIVPLMFGGDHSIDNLQPAHQSCNSRKGAIQQNKRAALNAQQRTQKPKTNDKPFFSDEKIIYRQQILIKI